MKKKNDAKKQFGDRIRKARNDKGMSHKDLADAVGGTAERTVANWETGKPPAVEKLIKMIQILEINPKYLFEPFTGKEDPKLSEIQERVRRVLKIIVH